jgi:hypothetical protein
MVRQPQVLTSVPSEAAKPGEQIAQETWLRIPWRESKVAAAAEMFPLGTI